MLKWPRSTVTVPCHRSRRRIPLNDPRVSVFVVLLTPRQTLTLKQVLFRSRRPTERYIYTHTHTHIHTHTHTHTHTQVCLYMCVCVSCPTGGGESPGVPSPPRPRSERIQGITRQRRHKLIITRHTAYNRATHFWRQITQQVRERAASR